MKTLTITDVYGDSFDITPHAASGVLLLDSTLAAVHIDAIAAATIIAYLQQWLREKSAK